MIDEDDLEDQKISTYLPTFNPTQVCRSSEIIGSETIRYKDRENISSL